MIIVMDEIVNEEKLNSGFPEIDEKVENEPPMSALNAENTKSENAETEEKQPQKWKGALFIALAAFCFSLMSVFVRLSGDLPTFQKAFFRNFVAAIASFFLLLKSGSFKMQKGSFPLLLARSAAGIIGILGNFYAIDNMNIADASILNKLSPFFTIIFSALLLKEKPAVLDWLMVALAFFGAIFVVKPSFDFSQSLPAFIGVLGGLGAGLAYTFVHALGKRGERNPMIVFFFSVFSCIVVLPVAIAQWQAMTGMQLLWLLLAGAAASGAQFSLTAAYSCAAAKDISVYDYSQVIFSAIWGAAFFAELPDLWSVLGYVIIIGAAVIKYVFAIKKNK